MMNWGAVDLNLLIVFDAVIRERSVTRAGNRIGLSQPAISHALNRLRHLLKDDLFIRTPEGMVPTPRAELLAHPLRHALSEMQIALEPDAFDPTKSTRAFSVSANYTASAVLIPRVVETVSSTGPYIHLDVRPSGRVNIAECLDRGEADLVLGNMENLGERFAIKPLFEDPFVLIMRSDHPAGNCALSPATIAALSHLDISSGPIDTDVIDRWLIQHGLTRRIALRTPYLSAAAILVQSDLVAMVSRRMAFELAKDQMLQITDTPHGSPKLLTTMLWHRKYDSDPAHRWLRNSILSASTRIGTPSPSSKGSR